MQKLQGQTSALRTGWGLSSTAPREALCSYRMGFRSAAWRN